VTALECGGERGRRAVGRGGERRVGVVALEHTHGGECHVLEHVLGDADVMVVR
jgi:hypothetical protein